MIAFTKLGTMGRFGNQLFQYAFLRLTAERLGVKFYCPRWIGDEIFLLEDENERVSEASGIVRTYVEGKYFGFNDSALDIQDGTDILGYFQTEKYFDIHKVRKWYTFREDAVKKVKERYSFIDFSECTGLSVRLGDFLNNPSAFVVPATYYEKALRYVRHKKYIFVFSDDPTSAKSLLRRINGNVFYEHDLSAYEALYLQALCHDFISSASTLGWWGAWLNSYQDKTIVVPSEGPVRRGSPFKNNDFWPEGWIKVPSLKGFFNGYRSAYLKRFILHKARNCKNSILRLSFFNN
jgi:hypothetical protein